jgi:hypothetical protein
MTIHTALLLCEIASGVRVQALSRVKRGVPRAIESFYTAKKDKKPEAGIFLTAI